MSDGPSAGNAPTYRLHGEQIKSGYDGTLIIDGVELRIPDRQITVLIGPNGCGKSTLLKTMARIITPTDGHVLLDGKDIHKSKTREIATKLGLLPQGPVTPDGLTVRELVCQGRFPHQTLMRQWTRKDEDAVLEAMSLADVADYATRPVDSLSGGQRQRCWIAMVLAQQTDLILLDEPTTFLDLKVQIDLMDLLGDLAHEQGRTLVLVLHELNLAAAYADHLVMMRDGKIVSSGSPEMTFTTERLDEVFDLDAQVIRDARTGQLICVPNGRRRRNAPKGQVA